MGATGEDPRRDEKAMGMQATADGPNRDYDPIRGREIQMVLEHFDLLELHIQRLPTTHDNVKNVLARLNESRMWFNKWAAGTNR